CPVLQGGRCPLVDGADAVVVALPAGDPSSGALVPIHRFCHPDIPVCYETAVGDEAPAWLPSGVPTLSRSTPPDAVVATLKALVEDW
ncbi:MAG TPA: hypothetical protein VI854_05125, partial [Acidimicrobiia bacterium]|nr:hypothetical protein [Acidimicrobiia bacterium]